MNSDQFSTYLEERYNNQIKWYDEKAVANQTVYKWMQWLMIIFAAVTPILIELKTTLEPFHLSHLATLTSAIVVILTAALKTFKYQENWINYRTTCETLRKEKFYYEAGLNEYQSAQDKEAVFVNRVESLISRENTLWLSSNRSDRKSNAPSPSTNAPSSP